MAALRNTVRKKSIPGFGTERSLETDFLSLPLLPGPVALGQRNPVTIEASLSSEATELPSQFAADALATAAL